MKNCNQSIDSDRVGLDPLGILLRSFLRTPQEKLLFEFYWQGFARFLPDNGDELPIFRLSDEVFQEIFDGGFEDPDDWGVVKLKSTNPWKAALGRIKPDFDENGNVIGFCDEYDFNWGLGLPISHTFTTIDVFGIEGEP